MGKVLKFPKNRFDSEIIRTIEVYQPINSHECLQMYKDFLEKEDYEDVLCSILDIEYYNNAEDCIKKLVDSYFTYNS